MIAAQVQWQKALSIEVQFFVLALWSSFCGAERKMVYSWYIVLPHVVGTFPLHVWRVRHRFCVVILIVSQL